jgi:hypothetical protein
VTMLLIFSSSSNRFTALSGSPEDYWIPSQFGTTHGKISFSVRCHFSVSCIFEGGFWRFGQVFGGLGRGWCLDWSGGRFHGQSGDVVENEKEHDFFRWSVVCMASSRRRRAESFSIWRPIPGISMCIFGTKGVDGYGLLSIIGRRDHYVDGGSLASSRGV